MSSKDRLVRDIEIALELGKAGKLSEAEMRLARIAQDEDAAVLGPVTELGLPRKLHSARLKLAKLGADVAALTGLRATAVPPHALLADLFPISDDTRAAMAEACCRKVPRIVHQIWIGERIPRPCETWRQWAARHGWEYRLWDEAALSRLGLSDDPAWCVMRQMGDLPGAVDVARYHILLREGGLYLDCDWYPIRPELGPTALFPECGMSAIAEAGPRLVGGGGMLLANGLIATPAGHPALRRLLNALPEVVERLRGGPAWWLTGPLPFTLALRGGPFTVLDSAFVAGRLPRGAELPEVLRAVEEARQGAGVLLEWKDW
ncbi:glycosyltransferase family 32 protein [Paracoccus aurantius]|uniref:glycosyltransferase family 32 protein n=1 Tax=Paracoccus aurantius TaxID=3073814 RepID=UPI0038FC147D